MNFIDPFDCVSDFCHLPWLIRDNPDLLKAVTGGRCINGTKFRQLVGPEWIQSLSGNIYLYKI